MKSTKSRQFNFSEQPPHHRICTSWMVPLLLLWMLPAGLGLMLSGRVSAQTFTTLYSFTATSGVNSTNSDGGNPWGSLSLSGNTLYGTTAWGGTNGNGTVFKVNADGTGFTNLYSFTSASGGEGFPGTNSDGVGPLAGLVLSGSTLYGTATEGGIWGSGTVFAVSTNGTGFTVLHSFTNVPSSLDGGLPQGGLVLSGNTLYGTTYYGGGVAAGTVFAVNTDGTGFTVLHSFTGGNDGEGPVATLLLSGNTLYGTAVGGGTNSGGTVFAVNPDGTGFTVLHSFTYGHRGPAGGLISSGNTLYGTTEGEVVGFKGASFSGTVFAVNTDGTGFTNLHSFTLDGTNSDGIGSSAGLVLWGNPLYGTANEGGSSGGGTVFAVNTNGTSFTVLHSFTGGSDGAESIAGLILSGNTLYGTARNGGTNGYGTVFSIFIQTQLTLIPSGPYVILAWPTNFSGFTLQSTTNFGPSAVWSTNSSAPVVIGGENVVINTMSGRQQFYRLSQ